jgi:hypothetical protein
MGKRSVLETIVAKGVKAERESEIAKVLRSALDEREGMKGRGNTYHRLGDRYFFVLSCFCVFRCTPVLSCGFAPAKEEYVD